MIEKEKNKINGRMEFWKKTERIYEAKYSVSQKLLKQAMRQIKDAVE